MTFIQDLVSRGTYVVDTTLDEIKANKEILWAGEDENYIYIESSDFLWVIDRKTGAVKGSGDNFTMFSVVTADEIKTITIPFDNIKL